MWLKPNAAIKELVDEINKFSGYFIFIWYNNTITGHKYKKWEKSTGRNYQIRIGNGCCNSKNRIF